MTSVVDSSFDSGFWGQKVDLSVIEKSSSPFLRINEALLCVISGEEKEQLNSLITLNLHIRDSRYPKIKEISNLHLVSNLRILNLSYNAIETINGLDMCRWLTELNLAENLIERIRGLEELGALERLNLSGNIISEIPKTISMNKKLVSLRLSRNRLSNIEDIRNLKSLKKLRKLKIDNNPFTAPGGNFQEDALEAFIVKELPLLAKMNDSDLTQPSVRQRVWLSQEKPSKSLQSPHQKIMLETDKENVIVNAVVPNDESGIDELQFSTPFAVRPMEIDALRLDDASTPSHTPQEVSPVKGFTVSKRGDNSRQNIVNRSDIDNLAIELSQDLSGYMDMSTATIADNTNLGEMRHLTSSQGKSQTIVGREQLLEQQIESLSSLLEQNEEEKVQLRQSLVDAQSEHERVESLLVEEAENRARAALEPALNKARNAVEDRDKKLAEMVDITRDMEEQIIAQKNEIGRLTTASKAVSNQYSMAVKEANARAQKSVDIATKEVQDLKAQLKDAQICLARSENISMRREEQDQIQTLKSQDAASRLHSLESMLEERREELNRCTQEIAALQIKLLAEQKKREEDAIMEAKDEEERFRKMRLKEERHRQEMNTIDITIAEKSQILAITESSIDRREEEQRHLRESVEELTRGVVELKAQTKRETADKEKVSSELLKCKRELMDTEAALQAILTRKDEEERKGEAVRSELSARLKEIEQEVEQLTTTYKQQLRQLREAKEQDKEEQKKREASRLAWDEENERWKHELFQARRSVDIARQGVTEEGCKLATLKARCRRVELDAERKEKEIETTVLAAQTEKNELNEEIDACRRQVKAMEREIEARQRDILELTKRDDERTEKFREKLSELNKAEEAANRRMTALQRQTAKDVEACQCAKELLETLHEKEEGLREQTNKTLQASQDAAHDLDRIRIEREKWRAKADTERHIVSSLEDTKAALTRDLARIRGDIDLLQVSLSTEREKECQAREDVDRERKEGVRLQEEVSRQQRRLLETERKEEVTKSREQEAHRSLERALCEKERIMQAAHEENLRMDKLLAEKKELRDSIANLETEKKRCVQEAAAIALDVEKAKVTLEGIEQQKHNATVDLSHIEHEREKLAAMLSSEKADLRSLEDSVVMAKNDVQSIEKDIRRAQSRLNDEEKRIEQKKQELSGLEQSIREAQTLLAQTYDSMHVERTRALKELDQLAGAKLDAQHAVHRARLVRPEHVRNSQIVSEDIHDVTSTAHQAQLDRETSNEQSNDPFDSKLSHGNTSDRDVKFSSPTDIVAAPALFCDVSDLRASVERLRRQSRAALQP